MEGHTQQEEIGRGLLSKVSQITSGICCYCQFRGAQVWLISL